VKDLLFYSQNQELIFQITEISSDAFKGNTNITSVSIPVSVKTIHSGAFSNCTNLSSVTILAVNPPELKQEGKNNKDAPSNWFYGNDSNRQFYVPDINAYISESLWNYYYSSYINPIN